MADEAKRDSDAGKNVKESPQNSTRESVQEVQKEAPKKSKAEETKAQSLVATKARRKEKSYDLDRDSFSKGVDPRDEDGENIDILMRIKKPLTWARLASGVRIVDLHEENYEEVLKIMQYTFFRDETLCKSLRLWEDPDSVASMSAACTMWMRDGCSLVAVQEGSSELLGAILMRVVTMVDHTRTVSRIRPTKCGQLVQGEAYQKILAFRCYLHKEADVFEKFDVTSYLRIYAVCVRPVQRGKGFGMAMLQSALQVAAALGQQVVMGIFTTAQSQAMAMKLGLRPVFEIYYRHWIKDGVVVFDDPGPGNYSAIVLAKRLPRVARF